MPPGKTEAGSAGTQPCPGITRWKLIEADDRRTALTAVLPFSIGFDRFPHALKIPAPQGRNSSLPKTATLHFTLNQDTLFCSAYFVGSSNVSFRVCVLSVSPLYFACGPTEISEEGSAHPVNELLT